ncbi:MAG: hypothetical protein QW267_05830 [Sulfolobales archaeon]
MKEGHIDREHIVRVCREFCIDAGYSGNSFIECVKECVSRNINKNSE